MSSVSPLRPIFYEHKPHTYVVGLFVCRVMTLNLACHVACTTDAIDS
jgi:hypothetical protein